MDANTPRAKAWFSSAGVPLVFTELHALEIRNALKLGVFRRLFAAVDAAAAWRIVQSDVRSGRLITTTVKWSLAFRVASRLAEGHSMTLGTRSLDVLHIAVAKVVRSAEFLSFDTRQRTLAAAVRLRVAP